MKLTIMKNFLSGKLRDNAKVMMVDLIPLLSKSRSKLNSSSDDLGSFCAKHNSVLRDMFLEASAINANKRDSSFRLTDELVPGYYLVLDNRYRTWKILAYEINKSLPENLDPTSSDYPRSYGASYLEMEYDDPFTAIRIVTYFQQDVINIDMPLKDIADLRSYDDRVFKDVYNFLENESLSVSKVRPTCVFGNRVKESVYLSDVATLAEYFISSGLQTHTHRTIYNLDTDSLFKAQYQGDVISNRSMCYINNTGVNKAVVNVRSQITYKDKRINGTSQSGRTNIALHLVKNDNVITATSMVVYPSVGVTRYVNF